MPPKYISLEQAAKLLGPSASTLRRKIADGELKAYRVNPRGKIFVRQGDVEQLLTVDRPDTAARDLVALEKATWEQFKAEQKSVQHGTPPVLH